MSVLARQAPVIEMLATGNELLDGSISDRHARRVGEALRALGLRLGRVSILADDRMALSRAFVESISRCDFLIVSGGLGPTTDDLSLEVAAEVFGRALVEDAKAKANVLRRMKVFKTSGLNSGHRKMFLIPRGAEALSNQEGTAPGVRLSLGQKQIFFLPGPPKEFDEVFFRHLLPELEARAPSEGLFLFQFKVFGKRESELNELMKSLPIPEGVEVGFRTTLPENHIKLSVRSKTEKEARKKIESLRRSIRKALGTAIFAEGTKSFEEAVFEDCLRAKMTLCLAESCTGGLASSLLTRVPGSSKLLERAFVTYSNASKMEMLGVARETLEKYGAVSAQCAKAMWAGALSGSAASHAAAITGIAGPSGGSPQKPVGTVWLAYGPRGKPPRLEELRLQFDRVLNQQFSAYAALQRLRELALS